MSEQKKIKVNFKVTECKSPEFINARIEGFDSYEPLVLDYVPSQKTLLDYAQKFINDYNFTGDALTVTVSMFRREHFDSAEFMQQAEIQNGRF